MATTKNLCAQIPIDLHERVSEERERLGQTTSEYIANLIQDYRTAREALDKAGWDVDYIITHCSPSSIQETFSGGLFRRDALMDFLDEVREHCRFQYWFFGHYHENMVVEKKFVMLYKQIIRLK